MQIDKQEALLREQERRKTTEEAKKKLWEQTEDVRKLKAAMFFSNVLAERKSQVDFQTASEQLNRTRDQQYHDQMVAKLQVQAATAWNAV